MTTKFYGVAISIGYPTGMLLTSSEFKSKSFKIGELSSVKKTVALILLQNTPYKERSFYVAKTHIKIAYRNILNMFNIIVTIRNEGK